MPANKKLNSAAEPKPAGDSVAGSPVGEWPAGTAPIIVCAQHSSRTERAILDSWIRANAPATADTSTAYVPYARGEDVSSIATALRRRLDDGDDRVLLPIRVVWQGHESEQLPHLMETLATGDPRHPRAQVHQLLRRVAPNRARVIVAAPATVGELREAWRQRSDADADAFPRFVARRLVLALERAESSLLGPQHKVPRLVREEIETSTRFRDGVRRLAERLGRDPDGVAAEARNYLGGLVAGHSRAETDFNLRISRKMYELGYEVDVDPEQLDRVREVMRKYPTVTLSSHRSYLDAAVLPVVSHERGLPRRHVLAGANMDFWPVGAITRRSGGIFIRRNSHDAPVYRFALREYLGYLVEKRFHLEWYIEGSRSRTGKMLPPKLGALVYVVDAYRDGRADDVLLLPVSITYDQLREVGDFASEAAGKAKQAEDAGWLLRYFRGMRDRYGKVYVRFAEPLSLREALGPPRRRADAEEADIELQKLGFEVSWRILQATPVTGSALLTLTLLTGVDRALTLSELRAALAVVIDFADRQELPMTASATALNTDDGLQAALDSLIHFGVLTRFDEGPEAVYGIGAGQHVVAAFYRNSVIHFFLDNAILELALVRAAESDVPDARNAFWDAAIALRDLLKFDFFFQDKERFKTRLSAELARTDPHWADRLATGPSGADELLGGFRFPVAHATLRPFLEAYLVVATALVADTTAPDNFDERAFLKSCAALGRQMLLQKRIERPESVAAQLFKPAIQLARNRGLLDDDGQTVKRRAEFAAELTEALRAVDVIADIARDNYVRLLARSAASAIGNG